MAERRPDQARPLLEQVLDYALYVPLGAALRLAEQVPELAASGRAVAGRQIDNARVIGRFAVGAARRQIESRLATRPAADAGAGAARADAADLDVTPIPEPPARSEGAAAARGGEVVADALAVPGYDALAASQVVPLLVGLTDAELADVQRYEEAHRNRRTVLGRIAQLQQERADRRA